MRHHHGYRKLGKSVSHSRALLRSLATSLILKERFETTVPRAKELRGVVEKLVTIAREDTLAHRRTAYAYLFDENAVHKLFTDIGPRCSGRKGGYTRVVRSRIRPGDAAELAVIEFVDGPAKAESSKASSKGNDAKAGAPKKRAAKKKEAVAA